MMFETTRSLPLFTSVSMLRLDLMLPSASSKPGRDVCSAKVHAHAIAARHG